MLNILRKWKLRKLLLGLPIVDKMEKRGVDMITDEMTLGEAVVWLLQPEDWDGFEIRGRQDNCVETGHFFHRSDRYYQIYRIGKREFQGQANVFDH